MSFLSNQYTYRYFLTNWPHLCFLCTSLMQEKAENEEGFGEETVGAIVCKQGFHRGKRKLNRGYIAMLTTKKEFRKIGIARKLVQLAMDQMIEDGAEERKKKIVLETEFDNSTALAFYGKLGFFKEKRLHAFYLNYKDAFRLVYPVLSDPLKESQDLFT